MRACWSRSTWYAALAARQRLRVTYVRNITDIDDKIIRRAVENGETIGAAHRPLHRGYMHEDAGALGVQKPDHEPRATHYVPQMLGHDRPASSATAYAYRPRRVT
jgi:cysteinyl-tRNA synthetase